MISVYYDAATDAVWVSNLAEPQRPRTLVAEGADPIIMLRRNAVGSPYLLQADYSLITDQNGGGFSSFAACLTYLQTVCSRAPTLVPSTVAAAAEAFSAGTPLCVDRTTGQLRAARADIYNLSFVCGLCDEDVLPGFAARAVRSAVTVTDWTPLAGEAALRLGLPYFLRVGGGITQTPSLAVGNTVTRIGIASDPSTLVFDFHGPVLL